MSENLVLKKRIWKIANDYKERTGKNLYDIAKAAGIAQNHLTRIANPNSTEQRYLKDEDAIKILVACDYRLSEAQRIVSEIKISEAVRGLSSEDKKKVLNSIIAGDNSIVIKGNNNSIKK